MSTLLSFGLPKSLEATLKLFASWVQYYEGSRSYTPSWDDPDLNGRFVRAQEMVDMLRTVLTAD